MNSENHKTSTDIFAFQRRLMEETLAFNKKMERATAIAMNPPDIDLKGTPHDVVYEENQVKILHYHPLVRDVHPVPLVLIYALVNKPYIFDIKPDRSVVRSLLLKGFDVYLIDWGEPGLEDKYLTIDDYVNGYIDRTIDVIRKRMDVPQVSILGYCMGGTFSAMYAALHPEKVRNLLVMAAPIDFEADTGVLRLWADKEYFDVDRVVDVLGNVPASFLNTGFLLLDPYNNLYGKYIKILDSIDNDDVMDIFLRMEKWLNDGVAVAGETYREFIKNGYQNNLLVKNEWVLNGQKVNLSKIEVPVCVIVADYDTLVPKESTLPFADFISSKDKEIMTFPKGHIGLSVSSGAHRHLWPDVAEWLAGRSGGERREEKKSEHGNLGSIKGIGPSYVKRLEKAGIKNLDELVTADRDKLSSATGIPKKTLNKWIDTIK